MLIGTAISIGISALVMTSLVALVSGASLAAWLGGGVSLLGVMLGLFLGHRALRSRPEGSLAHHTNRLLGAFVAAMLTRMVLLSASLSLVILVLGLDPLAFVASFFLVHFFGLVLEIRYLHRAGRCPAFQTS